MIAPSAAGGAAEDVSQTSNQHLSNRLQRQGGLQLEELAQTMQHRLPDPEGDVAAEAEVQAVVISEPGRFEAAENPRAGANVAGAAATAVRSGNAEAGGGFVTPQNSRSMRSAVELGEASGALPAGLRWLGRIGVFFRTGSGEGLPVQMWPSPFPSPERPAVDRGGAEGPLFGPDATRQLQVVQDRAPLLFGTPKGPQPCNPTPSSSSLSAEAIQAEVQRQLGPLLSFSKQPGRLKGVFYLSQSQRQPQLLNCYLSQDKQQLRKVAFYQMGEAWDQELHLRWVLLLV